MTEKITIIAEAGVNHNGKINLAYKLIDIAASSKADFVKFQITNADLITKKAKKAKYQINQNKSETQHEMIKKLEMDWEKINPLLMNYAKKRKIKFLTTAFDINGLNQLKKLKFKSYKVPSGEIINHPYLKHLAGFGSNVIMSTGMATMKEIDDAVSILINNGTKLKNITLMQCNTAYPTPFNDVNLRAMETMKNTFGTKVGYSDHTIGIEAAIAAAALGASIIEKHYTINPKMKGPDHKASLDPNKLKEMIEGIRNVESAFGSHIKKTTKSEMPNKIIARQSIVAKKDIKKGEIFSLDNLTCKRPGTGISPIKFESLLNKKAKKNFKFDDLISI
jgi:N,N'-diacetyllegionaminate synthase